MRISVAKEAVKSALELCGRVVNVKAAKEELRCVKIEAKDGKVSISGTNLEEWVSSYLDGVKIEREGSCAIDLSELRLFMKDAGNRGDIGLEIEGAGIKLSAEMSGSRIERSYKARNLDNWPEFPKRPGSFHNVPASFLSAIKQASRSWTIDAYLRAAKGLFAQMECQGVVFMNPAEGLHLQKVKGRTQQIPSIEDMDKLLSMPDVSISIGLRDRAILETAYSTACRLSELAHLKLDDVNLAAASITIRQGKGAKDRVAPLGRHAVKWLGLYLDKARPALLRDKEDQRHLWLNANGIGLSAEGVHWLFKHHSEDAKISPCVTIHSVRRLVATSMLQNGAHPAMIAEMLGHATLKTLGAYLRVTLKDLKDMQSKVEAGR